MSTLKETKKEYLSIVKQLLAQYEVGLLLARFKNIAIQLTEFLPKNYNGITDRLNIIGRYLNNKVTIKDVKKEANQLLKEAKSELDPIKNELLWAAMYAVSAIKKSNNLEYALLFLINALKIHLSTEEIKDIIKTLRI